MTQLRNLKPGSEFTLAGRRYTLKKLCSGSAIVREHGAPKEVDFVDRGGTPKQFFTEGGSTVRISLGAEVEPV